MTILIFFAFLAGIVTVLSPCILPVLPIVLSSSLTGGKRRPFGVVSGFVLSFTFFTLFLSTIVSATHISANALRTFSVVVIIGFGLSLLIPKVQAWIEQGFSRLSSLAPTQQKDGYWGGFIMGLSLGLIWTPCVGPILASVISLALTGSVSGTATLITLAYSLGTALPMLAITYGGRQLLLKVPWLLQNTGKIQKAFGVLMIITGLGIQFNLDRQFQTWILNTFPKYGSGLTAIEDNQAVQNQLNNLSDQPNTQQRGKPMFDVTLSDYDLAPELVGIGEWFNTQPLTLKELKGKVVIVDFWTYTCINCIRTLPYLNKWYEAYKDKGLVIIGVHTPEFEFEKSADNLKKAIADYGITYPVVQDNEYKTWRAYQNRYWPAKYIVDKNGKIRFEHFGEGKYDETEQVIQQLLAETGAEVDSSSISNTEPDIEANSPETYLGYERMERLASKEKVIPDTLTAFTPASSLELNSFDFAGKWLVGPERTMPTAGSYLDFHFDAKEVYLVMRPKGDKAGRVRVILDGGSPGQNTGKDVKEGIVTVDQDRLFNLISLPQAQDHIIRLEFLDDNVEVYAFTFG